MGLSESTKGIIKSFGGILDILNLGLESRHFLEKFLHDFGWQAPISEAELIVVNGAFTLKSALDQLRDLNDLLSQPDVDELAVLENVVQTVESLYTGIKSLASSQPTGGLPYPFDQTEFWTQLQDELPEYIIHRYLAEEHPNWFSILHFLGILDEDPMLPAGTEPALGGMDETGQVRLNYLRRRFRIDRIPDLISDPVGLFEDVYNWGPGKAFRHDRFLSAVNDLFEFGGFATIIKRPDPSILFEYYNPGSPHIGHIYSLEIPLLLLPSDFWDSVTEAGLMLMPIPANGNPGGMPEGFMITPLIEGSASGTFGDPTDGVGITIAGQFEADGLFRFNILPTGSGLEIDPGQVELDGGIYAESTPEEPWKILGSEEGFYILLEGAYAGFYLKGALTDPEFIIEVGTTKDDTTNPRNLIFGLNFADGDGFISKTFGGQKQEMKISGRLAWSNKQGFTVQGQVGFNIHLASHLSLGPLTFLDMNLSLSASGKNTALTLGTDVKLELGPFTAIVENIGASAILKNNDGAGGGIFGDIDFDFGLKPPNGIGLSLDAGVVKGGGYLLLDYEQGRYAGAIELDFQGLFGFTAIGIINTKFPDGSEGFSLLLLINVTFDSPIALGFNFYLSGIGGLIGLHRTMVTMAIQQGVKDGSIANILFPENVIANITKIISDLEAIFPAKQDQFVLGIMARITWNTPALLTIDAGLAVEFPSPFKIAILGVIRCSLPNPDKAIIQLNVAFAGIIDFEKKLLMFDASIFDSRILTITLEGDMALRISWGDQPDFLVSVGGFHPAFTPASHLQLLPMKRMTVNILSGNPKLVLTAYFAVTTNTIQFGAALDFAFTFSKFGAYAYFGFDVLIQFSPFKFIATVNARAAIKIGSSTLFSIDLQFNLEGPTPWRAHGYGSFRILFWKVKVKFDKTWGERRENTLPATSVLPLLVEEVNKENNWVTKPSTVLAELVTLSEINGDESTILVNPVGSLEVDQTVVPLDMTLEKFGNYRPNDISQVSLSGVSIENDALNSDDYTDLKNSFAPAAYKTMKDEDKLSAPSYEKQNSGVRITSMDELNFDYGINRLVEYETIISDWEEEEKLGRQSLSPDFFKVFVSGGDVGKSAMSILTKENRFRARSMVSLSEEQYAVVSTTDLSNVQENLFFNSKAEADEYLRATVQSDPSQAGKIQLSPAYQLEVV